MRDVIQLQFQFHKGTIRTFRSYVAEANNTISIP